MEKCFCLPVSQEKGRAAGDKADRGVKRLFIPSDSRKTFGSYDQCVCTTGFALRTAPPDKPASTD